MRKPNNLSNANWIKRTIDDKFQGDLYVAACGDDASNGSILAPFATLARAQQAVRDLREDGERRHLRVCVQAGEYRISSLEFDARDSNTTWYANGEVTLNGGMTLPPECFEPLTEEEKARLQPEARDAVMRIDLSGLGLSPVDWGRLYAVGACNTAAKYDGDTVGRSCELFFNQKRMTLARYPNGDEFLKIADVLDVGDVAEFPAQNYFTDWHKKRNHRGGTYVLDRETNKRVASWRSHDDIWMFGYFFWDWADSSTPVKEFDTKVRIVKPEYVSIFGCRRDAEYYFYNVFDELDEPGEWYLDRRTGWLYIYPPDDMSTAAIDLSLNTRPIINAVDVDGMVLDGFSCKCTRADAIVISGTKNTVRNCIVSNVSGNAIVITGTNNLVTGCEISHTGCGGIRISGGDREKLTPGKNIADNNLIHDWSEVYKTYQPAVSLEGVENICSHNEMYNSPHAAVIYYGNDHIVEYNYIHDAVLHSHDAGAIYSGQDWAGRGSVIRYNCLAQIGGGDFHPQGLYWDDGLSGQTSYGNVFIDIARWAVQIGGGRDIRVQNNLILNSGDKAIAYDVRNRDGLLHDGWARAGVIDKNSSMWTRLYQMPFRSDIWAARYPDLARLKEDFSQPDDPEFPINPAHSVISGNVIMDKKGSIGRIADAVYRYATIDKNVIYHQEEDPGFVDADNGDYRFRPDADALKKIPFWEQIPFEKIGRYQRK